MIEVPPSRVDRIQAAGPDVMILYRQGLSLYEQHHSFTVSRLTQHAVGITSVHPYSIAAIEP